MKEKYITITGMNHYYGLLPFKVGKKLGNGRLGILRFTLHTWAAASGTAASGAAARVDLYFSCVLLLEGLKCSFCHFTRPPS